MSYNGARVIRVPKNYGKVNFSREELRQILISVVAMTAIFTIFFYSTVNGWGDVGSTDALLITIGISALAVVLGFLIHELGHKVVAQKYGAWAEFRMYPMGFVLGFITAFLGFLFIAPGAVYIQGQVTKKQYGKISIAGPLTNVVIGSIFLGLWMVFDTGILGRSLNMLAVLSLFLAVFNLLPIPPLDGSKIIRWSLPVYVTTGSVA
ncbi:MAG: site-2 protease family protein, partial [Methanomassiliicoccales archaeon]